MNELFLIFDESGVLIDFALGEEPALASAWPGCTIDVYPTTADPARTIIVHANDTTTVYHNR